MLLIQYGIIKERKLQQILQEHVDPVYQTEPGFGLTLTTADVGPHFKKVVFTQQNMILALLIHIYQFLILVESIQKAPQSNALDRTFNFVFRGASGGGSIDTQDDTGDTQYTGGYGGLPKKHLH